MKIICNLPNASTLINGIPFEKKADGQLVSVDDVPENMIPIFLSINGYSELAELKDDAPETTTQQPENAGPWDNGQGDVQDVKDPEGDEQGTDEVLGTPPPNADDQGQETATQQPEKSGKKAASGKKS